MKQTRYVFRLCRKLLLVLTASMGAALNADAGDSALFGSSVYRESGESFEQALARHDAMFGPLHVVRVFFTQQQGVPGSWTSPQLNHGRPVVVSFKLLPRDVLNGVYDAPMRAWFLAAPRDRRVWWVYWHEPEEDIRDGRFTAEDYRAAFTRLDALADETGNPMLHTTQVLMDWTLDVHSGRNWRDYYPGASVIDVQAWDQYNYDFVNDDGTCAFRTMEEHETNRPAYQVTRAEGNDYAVAEIGARDCIEKRPDWLRAVGEWGRTRAVFVTYFSSTKGGDFRLTDAPSQDAWRSVINGSAFWAPPVLSAKAPADVTSTAVTLQCDVDPRELDTTFWFVSWRPSSGGAQEWKSHPPAMVTGGPEHRTLALTALRPDAVYRYVCKAQNNQVTKPVTSNVIEFRTGP